MKRTSAERGSAIIFLFIAVALFGALAYAFMSSSRTSTAWLENEQAKAAATGGQDCINTVNMAVKRLEARGCGTLISYREDGTPIADGPTDGSCSVFHTQGGGAKPCGGLAVEVCSLDDLNVGETCDGAIYAGMVSGRRIYAAATDQPNARYSTVATGGGSLGADSASNGLTNTNNMLANTSHPGYPHPAAESCRSIGPEWYLPARQELLLLGSVHNIGDFAGTFTYCAGCTGGGTHPQRYWTSTRQTTTNAYIVHFTGPIYDSYMNRATVARVRCVRSD